MFRVGIDVGGTNTDAAILDIEKISTPSRGVLATCKTLTTSDVTSGITSAIEQVLDKAQVDRGKIVNVAIGTTHFVNAVVENDARRLNRVAVFRLCGPYTQRAPPFSDFPYALRDIIEGPTFYLDGGLEIDGREITPLDPEQIRVAAAAVAEAGVKFVAIVGVFSALDHAGLHEDRCKALLREFQPQISAICSHPIGGPGLLPRENATILNAAILSFARRTVRGFRLAMSKLELAAPLYLTQNDGTLMDASVAAEFPIKTFASGPTNSLMGAAFLQGIGHSENRMTGTQLLVVDIGGTTTDVCAILPNGFPRQAPNYVEVAGVRTAFSMPEVLSVGLGGGSLVRQNETTGTVSVGPDSVAHRLSTDAMVFGGDTLTTTDVVVASGAACIGDPSLVENIPGTLIDSVKANIKRNLERAIDSMKVSATPVTVLLVGGGSILVTEDLEGVAHILRPPHHDSANAIGAAIAKVAGGVDIIEILADVPERKAMEKATEIALKAAIDNGADEGDLQIVDVKKIPLQYVSNKATRLVLKAVGSLRVNANILDLVEAATEVSDNGGDDNDSIHEEQAKAEVLNLQPGSLTKPTMNIDLPTYRPNVKNGVWYISAPDIEFIAAGAGILGTGGGGSPYLMALQSLDILRKNGPGRMRVVKLESLKDTDLCAFGVAYGAPSVADERIGSGEELFHAIEAVNKIMGITDFQGFVADEIGGGNGLVTFPSSARFDRPIIDCDLMGRAYPSLEHGTAQVYGHSVLPCVTADCKGNVSVVMASESIKRTESMVRNTCIELGNATAIARRPLTGDIIKEYAVPNTVSQAWYLGRAVYFARQTKLDFIQAISSITPVTLIYTGKIVDVVRDVSKGFTMGRCILAPLTAEEEETIFSSSNSTAPSETRKLVIPFQNEYLYAKYLQSPSPATSAAPKNSFDQQEEQEEEEVIISVPDLISILGADGQALGSPELRYGLKVCVIGMPAHPLWTGSAQGLKIGGPEFFGLGFEWKRNRSKIGDYVKPRSVIDEFNVAV